MMTENQHEEIGNALKPLKLAPDTDELETVIENILMLVKTAREQGYQQAVSDADEARVYEALKHCDDARLDF